MKLGRGVRLVLSYRELKKIFSSEFRIPGSELEFRAKSSADLLSILEFWTLEIGLG